MTTTQVSEEELADTAEEVFSPPDERDEKFTAEQAARREQAAREFIITKQHRRFTEFCDIAAIPHRIAELTTRLARSDKWPWER
jgi:hypothetical protein